MSIDSKLNLVYELEDLTAAKGALTLTNNNSATFTSGKLNNAATLVRSSSQYLSRANNALFTFGDVNFWVAAWIKANSWTSTASNFNGVAAKWESSGNQRAWALEHDGGDSRLRFFVSSNGTNSFGTTSQAAVWGSALSTGVWYWVLGEHDADANEIRFRVDNGTAATTSWSAGVFGTSTAPLEIGRFGGSVGHFDGQIDQVLIGTGVLTSDQRATIYNGGNGRLYSEFDVVAAAAPQAIWFM